MKNRFSYKILENGVYARCGITDLKRKDFVKKLPKNTKLVTWNKLKQ
jgi:hypothetical protein